MRTYVVCIDGTWNHPGQTDKDPIQQIETKTETNVLRMFRFLTGNRHFSQITAHNEMVLPLQLRNSDDVGINDDGGEVIYLAGIGTTGTFAKQAWDGATGTGTSERIIEAYRFLAERHNPGDRIFGFGFSRGAFAVRSLAGLLQHVGLPESPRKLNEQELSTLYTAYRQGCPYIPETNVESKQREVRVKFLGLWDTVGALAFQGKKSNFHKISPANVERVAHALALDELRRDFEPEFWENSGRTTVVEEAWFAGAHTNIGGGYENEELSNIALAWVISRAVDAGLASGQKYIEGWYGENSFGKARASHEEFLSWLGMIANLVRGKPTPRKIREAQAIHESVFDRLEEGTSEYVTLTAGKPADWQTYRPAATIGGRSVPSGRKEFNGTIVETPDYLDYVPGLAPAKADVTS